MRWSPRSLAGQLIAGLLAVMVAAYLTSLFAFIDERRLAIHESSRFQSLSRIASVVRLVESVPIGIRDSVVREAGGPLLRFTLTPKSAVDDEQSGFRARVIRHRLGRRLGDDDRAIRIGSVEEHDGFWQWGPWRHFRRHRDYVVSDDRDDDRRYWRRRNHRMRGSNPGGGMVIAVRLVDGNWLN